MSGRPLLGQRPCDNCVLEQLAKRVHMHPADLARHVVQIGGAIISRKRQKRT